MSMQCCIGNAKSEIRAIAETDGQLILIPVAKMNEWLGKYASWRNFVFNSYNMRLKEMLTTIDHLAFMNMDKRLLNYLLEKSKIKISKQITYTRNNDFTKISYPHRQTYFPSARTRREGMVVRSVSRSFT